MLDSIRVLYVEDNVVDQTLTRRHLDRHAPHIKLTTVGTVAEALDRLEVGDTDVVLADYRLPDATGLDLLEAIKARELRVPVVLVTGSGDATVAVRLLKAGAADYIVKRGDHLATLPVVLESSLRWFRSNNELRRAPIHILYAERDEADAELARRAFAEHDLPARVETVSSGREALTRLAAESWDVFLLDYRLPDLSGIEVLKELQAQEPRIPVVMVTGQGDEETAAQASKLGVADYLIKREGYLAKLPTTIEKVLAQRRLSDEKDALAVLNQLARSLVTITELDEVLRRVAEAARELIKAQSSIVWIVEAGEMRPAAWTGIDDTAVAGQRIRVDARLAADLESNRHISLQRVLARAGVAAAEGTEVRGHTLATSLVGPEGLLAVLAVASDRPREFTAMDERLLLALADHAAVAVENARLYRRLRGELEARERLTTIIEATTDIVLFTDATGRLLYLNQAGRALLGFGAQEALGGHLADLAPARLRAPLRDNLLASLIRDGRWTGEGVFLARDGREVRTWIAAIGHRAEDGTVEFLSLIARDLTERKRAEAELLRQRERLVQTEKLATMGSILAGVAHELNNPLVVVKGHAYLLQDALKETRQAQRAEKIAQAADRCARIVRNFLMLARQRPPERERVHLNPIVREALELLAYQLSVDNVEVVTDLADDLPILWADPHQLHQVVINLVKNAHDAMRQASTSRRVTLRTARAWDGQRVILEVADTGPGVPPEIQARIFEPFYTTKAVGQGTGLGLSLCLGLVEGHGGTLSLVSEPGQGALFRVELPVAAPPAQPMAPSATAAAPVVSGKRILVVEDEPQVAELLVEYLAEDRHVVEVAADGIRALEMLRRSAYDVILSDVRMPQFDGPSLYRELERSAPHLCRRFVLLTGDVLNRDTQTFLEQSIAPSLNKPFDLGDIRRVIRQVVGDPR